MSQSADLKSFNAESIPKSNNKDQYIKQQNDLKETESPQQFYQPIDSNNYGLMFAEITPLIQNIYSMTSHAVEAVDINQKSQQIKNHQIINFTLKSLQPHNFLQQNAQLLFNQEQGNFENQYGQQEDNNQINQRHGNFSQQQQDVYLILKQLFRNKFLIIGFFKLITIILLFLSPYFLDQLTNDIRQLQSITNNENIDKFKNIKLSMILNALLLIVSFSVFAICDTQYSWQISRLETEVRIYLNYFLYMQALNKKCINRAATKFSEPQQTEHKIVKESANEEEQQQQEEKKFEEKDIENQRVEHQNQQKVEIAELNNLISIDISTVLNSFISFHETWSLLLKLAIGLVYLYIKMKSAILIGFIITVLLIWLNFKIALAIGDNFGSVMTHKDKRIELTRDVIRGAKSIKCLNWEHLFLKKILQSRELEFNRIKFIKYLDAFCVIFWACSQLAISAITLAIYYYQNGGFQGVNIFTVIYLFGMIIAPLNSLPWTVGGLMTSKVSFNRINQFVSLIPYYTKSANGFKQQVEPSIQEVHQPFLKIRPALYTWPKQLISKQTLNNLNPSSNYQQTTQINTETNLNIVETNQFYLQIMEEIHFQKGQLICIVGPTGAGKTAFFNMILGELDIIENEQIINKANIDLQGKISYAPQQFWLQNLSIKDNILMTNVNNVSRYQQIITACDLTQDIKQRNTDNQTKNEIGEDRLVGPQGQCLSGGQKQRVNIGRAFYADADIFLLDDIFSSVDPQVASIIFNKGVKGLLHDKIRIMIVNDNKFIDKDIDQVILVQNGGQVTTNPALVEKYLGFDYKAKGQQPQKLILSNQSLNIQQQEVAQTQNNNQKSASSIEKDEEEREEGEIKIQTFKLYARAMGGVALLALLISMCLMQASFNFYDIWLKNFVNFNQRSEDGNAPFLFWNSFAWTIIVLAIVALICTIFRAFSFAIANLKAAKQIFLWLSDAVLFARLKFFEKNELGRILMRFSGDTWATDNNIAFESNILLKNLFIIAGSLGVIMVQTPIAIIPIVIMLYMFWRIQGQYRAASRELKRLDQVNSAIFLSHLNETQEGVKVIRAFNKQQVFADQFLQKMQDCIGSASLLSALSGWLSLRLQFLSILVSASLLFIVCGGGYMMTQQEKTSSFFSFDANTLALCLVYSLQITNLLRDLTMYLTTTEREFICLERINQYIQNNQIEDEIKTNEYNLLKLNEKNIQKAVQNRIAIEFKNVSLTYNQDSNNKSGKDIFALKNLSLQIKEGEKVVICGRTGSGKSSIFNVLLRLYDICNEQNGDYAHKPQILLYDQDIRNISLSELRQQITVVPQLGFLYKDSVRSNLDPNGFYSNTVLLSRLKEIFVDKSNQYMKEDEIQNNKGTIGFDLDLQLDSEGKNISQGEVQLLNFVRAALNEQASVICLDEATANLDQKYDQIVNKFIASLTTKTVICISHRLDQLQAYNRILVMDNGQIIEQGTYEQLTQDFGSAFNKLRKNGLL